MQTTILLYDRLAGEVIDATTGQRSAAPSDIALVTPPTPRLRGAVTPSLPHWHSATTGQTYVEIAASAQAGATPAADLLTHALPGCVAALFAQDTTLDATVPYTRENTFTLAATPIADGGTPPAAVFDLAAETAPVHEVAVSTVFTPTLLSTYPTLHAYARLALPLMLKAEVDNLLLNGNGTSPALTGILQTAGILAGGALNQGVDTSIDPIPLPVKRAITLIAAQAYCTATAIVMNPFDWDDVLTLRNADGSASPSSPPTLWGLPVLLSFALTAKTVVVGAFAQGAAVFTRHPATYDETVDLEPVASTSLALCVYRPKAFAKVLLQ